MIQHNPSFLVKSCLYSSTQPGKGGNREESRDMRSPCGHETQLSQGSAPETSNSLQCPEQNGPPCKPALLICHSSQLQGTDSLALPRLLTFAAEALLHPTESELLMQEFLLSAMLTLGHHTSEALEVLTAITTAELEHLVLGWGTGWGNRAATSGPSKSQVKGPLQTDVWSCSKIWVGVGILPASPRPQACH